jgi:hypothetical protein
MNEATNAAIRGALGGVAGGLVMYQMKQKVAPKVLPEEMRREGFAPKKAVELPARPVHDDAHSEEAEERPGQLGTVGAHTVHPPAPQDREHHEDASVGGIHSAEVRGLERGHHAVQEQDQPADGAEKSASALPEPEPD